MGDSRSDPGLQRTCMAHMAQDMEGCHHGLWAFHSSRWSCHACNCDPVQCLCKGRLSQDELAQADEADEDTCQLPDSERRFLNRNLEGASSFLARGIKVSASSWQNKVL